MYRRHSRQPTPIDEIYDGTKYPPKRKGQILTDLKVVVTKVVTLVIFLIRSLFGLFGQTFKHTSILSPVLFAIIIFLLICLIWSAGTMAVERIAFRLYKITTLVAKLSDLSQWIACITIGSGCVHPPDSLATILNITSSSTAELQQSYNMVGTLSPLSQSSHAMMINSVAESNL